MSDLFITVLMLMESGSPRNVTKWYVLVCSVNFAIYYVSYLCMSYRDITFLYAMIMQYLHLVKQNRKKAARHLLCVHRKPAFVLPFPDIWISSWVSWSCVVLLLCRLALVSHRKGKCVSWPLYYRGAATCFHLAASLMLPSLNVWISLGGVI